MCDFYSILGVTRDSDSDVIKKAYRSVALSHHPDRTGGDPESTARFREATEAYEVLRDPVRRRAYDGQILSTYASNTIRAEPEGGSVGRTRFGVNSLDLRVKLVVRITDLVRPSQHEIRVRRLGTCEGCQGTGDRYGQRPELCSVCAGRGCVSTGAEPQSDQSYRFSSPCPRCFGAPPRIDHPCRRCSGQGVTERVDEIRVELPAGVESGMEFRVRGYGNAAPLRTTCGDLLLQVAVAPDGRFERNGADVLTSVQVDPARAVLGGTMEVQGLEGRLQFALPAGAQPGSMLRLEKRGLPRIPDGTRGDLYVRVDVIMPTQLSAREIELYEELSRIRSR